MADEQYFEQIPPDQPQQQQPQQQPFQQVPSELVSYGQPQQQDADLTRWQLSFEDIVYEIRHHLRGEFFSEQKNKWIKTCDALMNEEGIGMVTLIISSYINKNTFLSNLDGDIILEIVRYVNFDIKNKLLVNYEKYDVNPDNLSIITNMVVTAIYSGMRRAFEEGEKRFLKLIQQREIVRTLTQGQSPDQKQGRWWLFGK